MADINYPDDVYASDGVGQNAPDPVNQGPATTFGRVFRIMGALASLALVAGVGLWGYKLMVRDVSGVPVVRALEGPMRIQPDDPGGAQADNQGLAVNAVAALGTAAPIADRVMLAPGPVELTAEDKPVTQGSVLAGAETGAKTEILTEILTETLAETGAETGAETETETETETANDLDSFSVEALVAQLTGRKITNDPVQDVMTSAEVGQDVTATDANLADNTTAIEPAQQTADLAGSGLPRSLRPHVRPARAVASGGTTPDSETVLNSAISGAVDTAARIGVDPDSLPVGTRLAQLGAFDSADVARMEWVKLTTKFDEYFTDKQQVVQKASSGGRTFYRLRAMGFEDLSAARRFCSALVSENADCIPVTTR